MRTFFPQGTVLGELSMVEVHDFYDRPVLFTCKNETGSHFLVVLVDRSPRDQTWLYAPVSPRRYKLIESGRVDLHDAFALVEGGFVYEVTTPFADELPHLQKVAAATLTENRLPASGETLHETEEAQASQTFSAATPGIFEATWSIFDQVVRGDTRTTAPIPSTAPWELKYA